MRGEKKGQRGKTMFNYNRKTSGRKDSTAINEHVYSERDGEKDTHMLNYNT